MTDPIPQLKKLTPNEPTGQGNSDSNIISSSASNLSDGQKSGGIEEKTEIEKVFERSPKLARWCELFLDKTNKATYGNKTESAMQAYDCNNRVTAGQIGYQNFKKLQGLASIFADDKGFTFEKLMNIALAKAVQSDNKAWWDEVMNLTGNRDPQQIQPTIGQQNNTQININGEDAKDFNSAFKKFLEKE